MEWWRKVAIGLSLYCLISTVVSSVLLITLGDMSIIEGIGWYLVIGFLTIYLYSGQFEGHDHFKTNKFSKFMHVICFPSLLVFSGMYISVKWIVGKVGRMR